MKRQSNRIGETSHLLISQLSSAEYQRERHRTARHRTNNPRSCGGHDRSIDTRRNPSAAPKSSSFNLRRFGQATMVALNRKEGNHRIRIRHATAETARHHLHAIMVQYTVLMKRCRRRLSLFVIFAVAAIWLAL